MLNPPKSNMSKTSSDFMNETEKITLKLKKVLMNLHQEGLDKICASFCSLSDTKAQTRLEDLSKDRRSFGLLHPCAICLDRTVDSIRRPSKASGSPY